MTRRCWLFLVVWPAWGHVISMSSGDLVVEGARAHYELRMPLYETAHVQNPERTLLDHIRFSSAGRAAKLLAKDCRADSASDVYLCSADYEFAAPVDSNDASIDVECTFYAITVPNHVHLLRAQIGDTPGSKHDEGIFDMTFTHTRLRFRPPTPAEIVATQSGAGFFRALAGIVQVLFLAALVLAARSARELVALVAMFLAGQAACVLIMPYTAWQPAPRFVEAAAALTVAYLAVEILLLPHAGARWLVAAVLGGFHGLYFHLFVRTTGYGAGLVLAGAAAAEVLAVAVLALVFSRVGRVAKALRPLQVAASGLLVFGLVWFAMRLRS
jgi:hypothetical protein